MKIKNTKDLKDAIRAGKYAWPGGYPCYFITSWGDPLSFEAVRENFYLVLDAVKHQYADGWCVVGVEVNWEDQDLICAHTGKKIESAY